MKIKLLFLLLVRARPILVEYNLRARPILVDYNLFVFDLTGDLYDPKVSKLSISLETRLPQVACSGKGGVSLGLQIKYRSKDISKIATKLKRTRLLQKRETGRTKHSVAIPVGMR